MSWLMRAVGFRQYFENIANDYVREDFREGTKLVHWWIQLTQGATTEWAVRMYRALDETMERDSHDGASGWGQFRNDVTTWLATWVRDHARLEDRQHLIVVAGCVERYLRALGSGHAPVTAPLAARWKAVLERNEPDELRALITEARETREMYLAGAVGVLPLIEASARVVERAGMEMSMEIRDVRSKRSGVALAAPLAVKVLPRRGGEEIVRFADVDRITIGRAEDARVRIDSDHVAREHAVIVREGNTIYIEDLNTDNRTFVFEEMIDGRDILQDKDILVIGGNLVVVENQTE